MKIVFLNIWRGALKAELTAFIRQEAPTTDIFCFQEADPAIRQHLRQCLQGFTEYAHDKFLNKHARFDQATYIRNDAEVTQTDVLLGHAPDSGLVLVTAIRRGHDMVTVANIHGISFPADDKLDTTGRLVQSETIIESFRDVHHPVVVGGDFNLLPQAESVRMFAEAGYQDLIADNHIRTTRNKLAWEKFPDNPQYYADYAFTSSDVRVHSFAVPELEVSDHLPLILEFTAAGTKELPRTATGADSAQPVA